MRKIKRAKGISIVLLFMMVFQLIIPVNLAYGDTISIDEEGGSPLSSSTSGAAIIATFDSGNEFGEERIKKAEINVTINGQGPGEDGKFTDIQVDSIVNVHFKFDFEAMDPTGEGYEYNKDDYFEFDWPEQIKFDNQPAEGWPLNNATGTYARVTFNGSKARITFVKDVPNADLYAEFTLNGKFTNIDEEDGDTVTINVGYGADEIEIGVNPPVIPPVSIELGKSSELDLAHKKIKWTVTVTPEAGKEAKEVVITDKFNISDNQKFVENSLKVEDSNNNDVTSTGTFTVEADKFIYEFKSPIKGKHTITYETDISDTLFSESGTTKSITYKNVVEGKAKDYVATPKPSEQTINWISKSASAQTGDNLGKIKWTVTIKNEDGLLKGKNGLQIIDIITGSHEFDAASLVQIKLNTDSTARNVGATDNGNGVYNISGSTLTYTFNDTDVNKDFTTAVLTYYTKIKDGGDNNDSETYKNNVKLIIPGVSENPSDSGSVGIGKGIVQKSVNGPHTYKNSGVIIDWTIYLNKNNQSGISNVSFVDTIPNGLEYVADSFKYDGNGVTPTVVENPNGTTTLSYQITGAIVGLKKITYQTKVKADYPGLITNGSVPFNNSATVTGTGINGTPYDSASTTVSNTVITKIVNSEYDYDTRELSWKITINQNKLPLKGVDITDIIPEGMEFLRDTFRFDEEPLSEIDQSKLTEGTANSGKNKTFIFNVGDTSATHTITFKTKATEKYIEDNLNKSGGITFNNKAELSSGGKKVTAEASKKIDNDVVRKEGVRTGLDLVKWHVPINLNKIDLGPIELSDKLQEELSLDVESVRLYKLNVGLDGKYKDGDEYRYALPKENLALDSSKYEVRYENNVFTFNFKEEIGKEVYILEFITFINATTTVTIKNTIELKGVTVANNPSSNMGTINVNEWSGSAGSNAAKLTIHKIDEKTGDALSGAVFELRNSKGKTFEDKAIDENGSIYEGLNLSRYYIKEIKAPDGYLKYDHNAPGEDPKGIQVSVNHAEGIEYFFKNKKAEADITLIKKSELGDTLSGAEFTLYESDGETKLAIAGNPYTSESDGKVIFAGIPKGNYVIKETKVPNGYKKLDNMNVSVSINAEGTAMIVKIDDKKVIGDYDAINKLATDDVMVIKVDTSEHGLLGATFGIYNQSGEEIGTSSSDSNGTVQFKSIAAGKYTIKEISAPEGYIKTEEVIHVNVEKIDGKLRISYGTSDGTYNFIEPQMVKNNSIDISFNKEDNNNKPLAGAEFTLYNSEGAPILKGGEIVTASSGGDGKIVFTAIPAGTYIIKETKAPSGYRNYEKEITAVVSENGTVVFTVDEQSSAELTVVNVKKPSGGGEPVKVYGKVTVKKVDEGKKALAGAEFTLYDSNGKVVGRAVTGSDGTVSFEELEPGDYVLKETKAPEGYVLDEKETDVTISGSQTKSYTLTNKKEEPKKPGSIEIIKTDEDGKALSGARFALVDDKGATLQTVDTVNGRAVFEDVPVGKYTVKEVQAPDGYELSTRTISVTVESEKIITVRFENRLIDKPTTPVDPNNPVIPEGPKAGSISITKVDENSMALPGAEFTLYNEDNQIIGTAVSDINGRVMFENLKEGTYYVEETNAPEGYALVDDVLVVDVTETRTYSYRFKNVPESMLIEDPNIPLGWETIEDPDVPLDTAKPADKLPDTGSIFDTWLLAVIGLIFILAGVFMYRRRVLN